MRTIKKIKALLLCAVILAGALIPAAGAAEELNDYDNHIFCDNSEYTIPSEPIRLDASKGWERSEKNLITNFYSMYQPEVVYVPEWDTEEGYPYIMWFFAWAYTQENDPQGAYPGYAGGDAIFTARAKNPEGPWEIYSLDYETGEYFWDTEMLPFYWYPVIECQDTWYDSWHVGDPSVVYRDGQFYMAYSAMGCDEDMIPAHKPGDTDGNTGCIMGAVSSDGIHWTRSAQPLIVWSGEKGYNENDNYNDYLGGHQRPSLMFEDGKWKMWYDYRYNQIGYAECSGDFMTGTWKETVTGKKGLLYGVDFDVVKIGDIYYAYGDPYVSWVGVKDKDIPYYSDDPSQWSQRQIVEYQSRDGINWTATGYFLPDTGYDANQIPQVFLDRKENRVYIFYATQRGKKYSSSYDWRWDNIRCMSRDVSLFAEDAGSVNIATATPTATVSDTTTAQPEGTESAGTVQESATAVTGGAANHSATAAGTPGTPDSKLPIIVFAVSAIISVAIVTAALLIKKKK